MDVGVICKPGSKQQKHIISHGNRGFHHPQLNCVLIGSGGYSPTRALLLYQHSGEILAGLAWIGLRWSERLDGPEFSVCAIFSGNLSAEGFHLFCYPKIDAKTGACLWGSFFALFREKVLFG